MSKLPVLAVQANVSDTDSISGTGNDDYNYHYCNDSGNKTDDNWCESDSAGKGNVCVFTTKGLKSQVDHNKKIRREIANSNERRRMQSINSGFQSLRTLLPQTDGEKLSKAAILQQTTHYLYKILKEKEQLLSQNMQLKLMLTKFNKADHDSGNDSPPPKRSKCDTVSSDEGVADMDDNAALIEEMRREILEVRVQLDREHRIRLMLEKQKASLEQKLDMINAERLHDLHPHIPSYFYHHALCKEEEDVHKSNIPPYVECIEQQVNVVTPPEPLSINAAPPEAAPSVFASQMSRQNLETIVQAIKYLEGDKGDEQHPVESSSSRERKTIFTLSEKHPILKEELHRPLTQCRRPGVIVSS